jgi:glycosyltransferase involved in cell wall biosynthesis
MKILYIGAEASNWVVRLCSEISKQGHEVTAIVRNDDSYHDDVEKTDSLTVYSVPSHLFFNFPSLAAFINDHIKDGKYDLVFGSHIPCVEMTKAVADYINVPWGFMILDIPSDLMAEDKNRMSNWYNYFWLLRDAKEVVFNTGVARQEFFRYTNRMVSDDNLFPYATAFRSNYKNYRGERRNEIISVCRLTELKNCILIPKALSLLKNPPKYVCIGRDNGQLSIIRDMCAENGIVFEYLDNVTEEEKYRRISEASALVYPQKTEYIGGLSPFEAMYVGTPALVPDLKVLRDLYGDAAFSYFENNNEVDLASKISFVTNLKRNKHIDSWLSVASAYAEHEASFDKMAESILVVMEKIKNG